MSFWGSQYNEDDGRKRFEDEYLGCWVNDAVFPRELVMKWLDRGEIDRHQAEILLRLRWETSQKKTAKL